MIRPRTTAAALALSAAGLVAILAQEGYVGEAMIPTKNDRPTVGFGSTFDEAGAPVKIGDRLDPVPALQRSLIHIAKDETRLKYCVGGALYQAEYDVLVDFAYQYGVPTACKSSIVRHINAGRYDEACEAYTLYRYSGGYDCSITVGGKPNKRCWGVWQRSLERRAKCLAAGT